MIERSFNITFDQKSIFRSIFLKCDVQSDCSEMLHKMCGSTHTNVSLQGVLVAGQNCKCI